MSEAITPGTFYRMNFDMQAKDMVVPAGRRLGLMVLSSDREYTVRPAPGTKVTLDLAGSSFSLPVVGGAKGLATATGGDLEERPVGGSVPATLALDARPGGHVRPVHPGRGERLHGEHDGERDLARPVTRG